MAEVGALDAGAVELRLGADFDDRGFKKYDEAIAGAERKKAVKAQLGAEFDERAFDAYERRLADARLKAQRKQAFQVSLGGDFDPRAFNAMERDLARVRREERLTGDETKSLTRNVANLNTGMTFFSRTMSLIKWPGMIAGAGYATSAIGSLGAGVVALGGALAPVTGAVAAAPVLFTAFGQALGTTGLATMGVKEALGDLGEPLDETSDAFKQLTPEAQAFTRTLKGLEPEVRRMQQTAQAGLFPGLQRGLTAARPVLPAIRGVVRQTARGLGRLAGEAGEQLGQREVVQDIEQVGRRNVPIMMALGRAGLNVAQALRHITVAAQPMVTWMARMAEGWTDNIEGAAKQGRETGRLADFFEKTRRVMERLFSIAGSLAEGFWEIGKAGAPLGRTILKDLDKLAERFADWTKSADGKNKIAEYFRTAKGPIYAVAGLVGDIVEMFFSLSSSEKGRKGFTDVVQTVRKDLLPVLEDVIENTTAAFGPRVVDLLTELLKLFGSFAGTSGPLNVFVDLLAAMVRSVNWMIDNVPYFQEFATVWLGIASTLKVMKFGAAISGFSQIKNAVVGITSAKFTPGGILDAIKGTGKARGMTPATPLFVEDVTGGGGVGAGKLGKVATGATAARLLPIFGPAGIAVGMVAAGYIATSMKLTPKDVKDIETRTGSPSAPREEGRRPGRDPIERTGLTPGTLSTTPEQVEREKKLLDRSKANHSSWVKGVRDSIGDVNRSQKNYVAQSRQAFHAAGDHLENLKDRSARITKRIKERFDEDTGKGRDALARHYREARDAAKRYMDRTGVVTDKGLQFIKNMFIKEQLLYGASRGEAEASFRQESSDQTSHKPFSRDGGSTPGAQQGAVLVPGRGSGDHVPVHVGGRLAALVEPGELVSVLNRRATAAMMSYNQQVPRFAVGGMVRVPGDPNDTGGRDLVSRSVAGTVGQWVRRYRANVGYAYDPGGGHQSPGHNVTGTATDVYPGPGGSWDLLEAGLKLLVSRGLTVYYGSNGIGTPLANHGRGNHAHIEWGGAGGIPIEMPGIKPIRMRGGVGGPHRQLVTRGLDKVRRRANRRLRRMYMDMFTGSGGPGGPGHLSKRQLAALWIKAGGDPDVASIAAAVALAESGGNPDAQGPLTSYGFRAAGLWQIHPPQSGSFNPLMNAQQAVGKYKAAGGWSPWEAYTNGNYRQFLESGGVLRLREGGPVSGLSMLPSLVTGGGSVDGSIDVPGKSLHGVLTNFQDKYGAESKAVTEAEGKVEFLGQQADNQERMFSLSEEKVVVVPEDGSPPYIDQTALAQQLKELKRLEKLRQAVFDWAASAVRHTVHAVQIFRGAIARLRELRNNIKGKGKAAQERRGRYNTNIDKLLGGVANVQDRLSLRRQSGFEKYLDWREASDELTAAPGAAESGLKEAVEGGGGAATPEQIAAEAYKQLESYKSSVGQLLGQYGRNFVPAGQNPFSTEAGQLGGARYFGAASAGDVAGGVGTGIRGAATTIEQNITFQGGPTDERQFQQIAAFEARAAF